MFKKIKNDYYNKIIIPEEFRGTGIGTTGVFLETNRGKKCKNSN